MSATQGIKAGREKKSGLLAESLREARTWLQSHQNTDSGWGYVPGAQSFSEPTCYALLALMDSTEPADRKAQREHNVLGWFDKHHNAAGALSFEGDSQHCDNWGTILACFTLQRLGVEKTLRNDFQQFLMQSRGNRVARESAEPLKLNGELQAWSWAQGTASWVEPTAYGLLAMKALGMRDHERVKTGESFLLDRACYDGGWNYGNKEVLDVKLEPMPTNTAFALMALQDFDPQHEVIQKSLAYFEKELSERQSTLTLSLGILCLDLFKRPVETLLDELVKKQEEDGSWRNNSHLTALAALALATTVEKKNVFRI